MSPKTYIEQHRSQSNASLPSLSQDLPPTLDFENETALGFEVYLLNQPVQCILISLIMVVAIICNALIIHNIGRCQVCKNVAIRMSK